MRYRLLMCAAGLAAMSLSVGCETEDAQPDDNGNDKKKDGELEQFYQRVSHTSDYQTLGYYDTLRNNIPAGIYTCLNPDGDYPEMLICKGTDGSLILFNSVALQEKSAFIGSNLYVSCRADDGKVSSYWIYNDHFGKADNYAPAPSYHRFEYLSREELLSHDYFGESNLVKISFQIESMFSPHLGWKYSSEECNLNSEKTEYLGIPCTHYYITIKEGATLKYYDGTPPKIIQEWWLTDNNVCLKQFDFRSDNDEVITHVEPAGTMADNYEKVMAKYSVYPDAKWSSCLVSHKKYANEWLSDEYPRSVDNLGLVKYEGELASFEVNRRAWRGYGNVTSIIFTATKCNADDVRGYIAKVKALGLSNQYDDVDETDTDGRVYISYSASNFDATSPNLGETDCYPDYEIYYQKWEGEQMSKNEFSVSFDVARLTAL